MRSLLAGRRARNGSQRTGTLRRAVSRWVEELEDRRLLAAVITDRADYFFGETAQINGTGFGPGETVQLQVLHEEGSAGSNAHAQNQAWQVRADTAGNLSAEWLVEDPDAIGASYVLMAVGLESGLAAQTQFTDSKPVVSIRSLDPQAGEGGKDYATFTISRESVTTGMLAVYYTIEGTAKNGVDYGAISGYAMISGNTMATTVTIRPIDDAVGEGMETVTITLAESFTYDIGPGRSVTLNIADNDDGDAPMTEASVAGVPGENGWWRSGVRVDLAAADNEGGSGMKQIVYGASGAQMIEPTVESSSSTSLWIGAEGTTTVSYYAVDQAGNVEAVKTIVIHIDETTPVASVWPESQTQAPGTVARWDVTDAISGMDPASFQVTLDGVLASADLSGSVVLPPGIHKLMLSGRDLAGNAVHVSHDYIAQGAMVVGADVVIVGTEDADTILVDAKDPQNILVNGTNAAGTLRVGEGGRIIVYGLGGDDVVRVIGRTDAELHGGAGSDSLFGGMGQDVVIGGEGEDRLIGARRDDVLIGGEVDLGRVTEWSRASIAALAADGEDDDRDVLNGGAGEDWLISGPGDKVTGAGQGKKNAPVVKKSSHGAKR